MTIEYRCTCRKCGAFWCFNDADLAENKRKKAGSALNLLNSAINAWDGRAIGSIYQSETSSRYANGMVDYSRCPKCGSINIAVEQHQF